MDTTLVGQLEWITRPVGGKADLYLKEVIEVILPFAQTIANCEPTWVMLGSSMEVSLPSRR